MIYVKEYKILYKRLITKMFLKATPKIKIKEKIRWRLGLERSLKGLSRNKR